MNENELRTLLREHEPSPPTIDRVAIVEQLVDRSSVAANPTSTWRTAIARAAICGGVVAASLLIFLWYGPTATAPRVSNPPVSNLPSEASLALEASVRSSDQLELEVIALLAATPAHASLANTFSRPRDEANSPELQSERFKTYRERIRASESLWLLLETASPQDASLARSIVELYPDTPAAIRCQKLVMN